MYEAHVGPIKDLDINHKNGVKDDNKLENLEAVTKSQNIRHALYALQTRDTNQKLTADQAFEIREKFSEEVALFETKMSEKYLVLPATIRAVLTGKTWDEAGGFAETCKLARKVRENRLLPNEKVIEIREKKASGVSIPALAEEYGLKKCMVATLVRGASYADVGGPLHVGKQHLSEEQRREVRRLHQEGMADRELAKAFGVTTPTIRKIIKEN